MENPLDQIKNEIDKIKQDVGIAVEATIQRQIAITALSRLAVLCPDKQMYSQALDVIGKL